MVVIIDFNTPSSFIPKTYPRQFFCGEGGGTGGGGRPGEKGAGGVWEAGEEGA